MPFTIKISRSITEIGQKEWESAYPLIPEGYGYLKTSEQTLGLQFKFYYVSIYDEGKIVFVAPVFVADYPLTTTLGQRIVPKLFTLRVCICGSPTCEGRLGMRETLRWKEMLDILVREMDSIAKKEGASVLAFKEFSKVYDDPFAFLKKQGFHKFSALPSVELDLPFGSFEKYLSTLSKKTREDLRRKFKKVDGLVKIEMEVREELGGLLDEAYALYLANLDKAEMTFEKITKDFFRKIPKNMPGQTRFFIWRIDGRLVAFSMCLLSGDLMVGEYLGFDYSVAYKYHLYFIAFRDKITWCIKNGIRKYETGALNYDPKKRLDFKFIPQYIYAKHRNSIRNHLLSILIWALEPQRHDPVLRSMAKTS